MDEESMQKKLKDLGSALQQAWEYATRMPNADEEGSIALRLVVMMEEIQIQLVELD